MLRHVLQFTKISPQKFKRDKRKTQVADEILIALGVLYSHCSEKFIYINWLLVMPGQWWIDILLPGRQLSYHDGAVVLTEI